MGAMAQPHKGPRRLVQTRIPEEVYAELVRRAREAGTSTSQYIADSMALSVGRDDLVWELGREREALPLAM
jgi:predicted HicB family RNase H-like nuclease